VIKPMRAALVAAVLAQAACINWSGGASCNNGVKDADETDVDCAVSVWRIAP
jgi:hypothetical protein